MCDIFKELSNAVGDLTGTSVARKAAEDQARQIREAAQQTASSASEAARQASTQQDLAVSRSSAEEAARVAAESVKPGTVSVDVGPKDTTSTGRKRARFQVGDTGSSSGGGGGSGSIRI